MDLAGVPFVVSWVLSSLNGPVAGRVVVRGLMSSLTVFVIPCRDGGPGGWGSDPVQESGSTRALTRPLG